MSLACPLLSAAVRPGNDLQQVAIRVFPVQAAPAVVGVELTWTPPERVCPVSQSALFDPREDVVEIGLFDEECIVLRIGRPMVVGEVPRHTVVRLDGHVWV